MRALVIVLLAGGAAHAQPTDAKATAETLWQDARTLMAAGRYADACPKLETSQRLDPAVGTELNLGDCYEHLGRFASAWGMFKQAADEAHRAADADAEKAGHDRAAALEPKLSRLTIQLPKEAIVGLVVTRNGVTVDITLLGTAMTVDAGPQKIECNAPGRKGWTQELKLDVGASVVAAVPNLAVDTTKATSGNSDLQITVDERSERYEVSVSTTGGTLRCDGFVTHETPCKLKAPAGPALMSIHGTTTLSEDLKLKGKPVLISVEKNGHYMLYGGALTAGLGAVALGVGLYGCSQRSDGDGTNSSAGLTCVIGASFGGAGIVTGGAMVIWDLFTEHHMINVHGDEDDDEGAVTIRRGVHGYFTGAGLGLAGSF